MTQRAAQAFRLSAQTDRQIADLIETLSDELRSPQTKTDIIRITAHELHRKKIRSAFPPAAGPGAG